MTGIGASICFLLALVAHQGSAILKNPGKKSERNGRNRILRNSDSGSHRNDDDGFGSFLLLPRINVSKHSIIQNTKHNESGLRGWVSRLDSAGRRNGGSLLRGLDRDRATVRREALSSPVAARRRALVDEFWGLSAITGP